MMLYKLARVAFPVSLALGLSAAASGQTATLVEFPDPAKLFQNASFTMNGTVAYVPTFDNDTLWSFSLVTGDLLDPDGLALPTPGNASDGFLIGDKKLAIPGWFPDQAVFVADVSDPFNLQAIGVITLPGGTNIQGQEIAVDPDGDIGYVASYPNDTLYSFNTDTMQLEDLDGLLLPGNPDRMVLANNDRLAIVDTTNKRIMVVDVSDPANLAVTGTITLPGAGSFSSNDTIALAEDGHTAYIASDNRILYSFDIATMTVLDPDGVAFGSQGGAYGVVIHGDRAACPWDRGLTFFNIVDPTNLAVVADASFGGVVAPQGNATVGFSGDGSKAAMPVIYPGNYVYTFYVETGVQYAPRYTVSTQPNELTVFGSADLVGVLCSGGDASKIWLIDGLLGGSWVGDLNCDLEVGFRDINAFVLAISNPDAYATAYPDCNILNGDCNGDGQLGFADINPFVALLSGGSLPLMCP